MVREKKGRDESETYSRRFDNISFQHCQRFVNFLITTLLDGQKKEMGVTNTLA